jgi:hypothetical protein
MYAKYRAYRQSQVELRQRQAGRQYEDYVAQILRQDGWQVDETGRNGFNDHGIDLIASKDGVKRYVQCKGMKRKWLIHEDIVSHLFGSVAAIEGPDNLAGVEMYLYSPAQLDSYAETEAARLNIHFVQLDYPWHRRHKYRFPSRNQGE